MSTPTPGDVLIVSQDGFHAVSIFPEKAPVSFKSPPTRENLQTDGYGNIRQRLSGTKMKRQSI
jgi:hypothetical protein